MPFYRNKMKYILFSKIYIFLRQFNVTPENKAQETYKLPNNYDKR